MSSASSSGHVTSISDVAAALSRDGVARLGSVLTPLQVDRVAAWLSDRDRMSAHALDDLQPELDETGDGRARLRKIRRLFWSNREFWSRIFVGSPIARLAESIVGPGAALVFHAAFMKPAAFGSRTALHQDQALWDVDYPGALTIWIAITPTDASNGCLIGYPGSHRRGLIAHEPLAGYDRHAAIAAHRFAGETPDHYELHAGDAVAWDRFFAHESAVNTSDRDRQAVVAVFADASVPSFRAKDSATLRSMIDTLQPVRYDKGLR
jgi:Phytanoyl-CoA dioxygenase (PhyH)